MDTRSRAALAAALLAAGCGEGTIGFRLPSAPEVPGAASLSIVTRDLRLLSDSSVQLSAVVRDQHGDLLPTHIRWRSSNSTIVLVDTLGVAYARYAGAVRVVAS